MYAVSLNELIFSDLLLSLYTQSCSCYPFTVQNIQNKKIEYLIARFLSLYSE
ncbi:unnamed protein product [Moneuplotes crassus]|uniref:Uncharacterized protein n=1 Tax=Euplotes crassus TaxID=5936 RepID=A0AAD1XXY2_EUPCR|nr:unnamed protein product [Moneuplotes crassus]